MATKLTLREKKINAQIKKIRRLRDKKIAKIRRLSIKRIRKLEKRKKKIIKIRKQRLKKAKKKPRTITEARKIHESKQIFTHMRFQLILEDTSLTGSDRFIMIAGVAGEKGYHSFNAIGKITNPNSLNEAKINAEFILRDKRIKVNMNSGLYLVFFKIRTKEGKIRHKNIFKRSFKVI